MRKLGIGLGIILVLSLLWCAIPVLGGWSWACDSPTFLIKDREGKGVEVTVGMQVDTSQDPAQFDPSQVKIVLQVPRWAYVEVLKDDGVTVNITNGHDDGEVKLEVGVKGSSRHECSLAWVTVKCDGRRIEPSKAKPQKWLFEFELQGLEED